MSAQVRDWDSHSDRWKATQRKRGVSPQRWNAWRKLSPTARKKSSPQRYGAGESVASQARNDLVESVVDKLHQRALDRSPTPVDRRAVQRNVKRVSSRHLRRIERMNAEQLEADAERMSKRAHTGVPSPYWYH